MPAAPLQVRWLPSSGDAMPQQSCGKFLQLRWRGRETLLFAPAESHRYHNQILAAFAAEQGLPHRWITPERLELNHPDLLVIGGGRFDLDLASGSLRLWDASQAYGGFRPEGLAAALAQAGPPWGSLSLAIA